MRSFKKPSRFNGDSGRSSERSFKKSGGSSGRSSGSNRFSGRSFGTKESKSGNGFKLHQAVCDKCGNNCDLPFEPTQGKPIYCRSCFRATQKGGSSSNFKSGKKSNDRFDSREDKFDRDFEPKSEVSQDALDKINRKLDKIMKALKID